MAEPVQHAPAIDPPHRRLLRQKSTRLHQSNPPAIDPSSTSPTGRILYSGF
ncbi:MAG: hypothetical protein NZ602_00760 [Thermoguttaceae bacterium]|nr:hypothetical protein [Thermoguttaceae bacterium]MDW8036840.1 hypothetical protein [Thermoguttaceae bacterium]